MVGPLPGHLRDDVRFDHAAAAAAVDALRRLAGALEDHAVGRARWLAGADHFRGRGRRTVDELTHRHGQRVAALVRSLHAEAARIEVDAAAARRAEARLERARAEWWSRRRSRG